MTKATAAARAAKIDWNMILLNTMAPIIQAALSAVLVELFAKLKPADLKTVLFSLYPAVDVQLEGLVGKTKTKLDDAGVLAIKMALEQSAELNGIDLPNLDSD